MVPVNVFMILHKYCWVRFFSPFFLLIIMGDFILHVPTSIYLVYTLHSTVSVEAVKSEQGASQSKSTM